MAVINEYVDAKIVSGKLTTAARAQGTKIITAHQGFQVAAADDNASVYRLFKDIPSTAILKSLKVMNDAITGGTDYDIGLYLPNYGVVVDKDLLADGLDLSSAHLRTTWLDGLVTVDIANFELTLWELAVLITSGLGYTAQNKPASFDICLTANTVGTAAGDVLAELEFYNP